MLIHLQYHSMSSLPLVAKPVSEAPVSLLVLEAVFFIRQWIRELFMNTGEIAKAEKSTKK